MEINILPNIYLKEDGTFDKEKAFILCGHIAGVCYDEEGFERLVNEERAKTERRIERTLSAGHHSVYDHIYINFNLKNIPKILAMVINNEKQYTTSEKSLRYTKVGQNEKISSKEEELYNKWVSIFKEEIKKKYPFFKIGNIRRLAQENARYIITIFIPTTMIYTTSLRQINYLASWMDKYIKSSSLDSSFKQKLTSNMQEFIDNLRKLNVLDDRLMSNEKNRSLSLFAPSYDEEYFGHIYNTSYKGSFASLAQAQRHRTINYEMNFLNEEEYFIPPIIKDNNALTLEWLRDLRSVCDVYPQGRLVQIRENGTYEDFILKAKERLCTNAQLEIMLQTKDTLEKYYQALLKKNSPLTLDITSRMKGARCTFCDYSCPNDCHFKEGKTLSRKI